MKKMQHYVPQFYMKYWGDGNKQLWQYRKDRNRFLKCSTTQKGCCNYDLLYELPEDIKIKTAEGIFAPNYLEDAFASKETEWAHMLNTLFRKIEDGEKYQHIFDDKIKIQIAEFVSNLIVRNPIYNYETTVRQMADDYTSFIAPVLPLFGDGEYDQYKPSIEEVIKKQLIVPIDGFVCEDTRPVVGSVYKSWVNKLLRMRMFFLKSDKGNFIFSNCPPIHSNYPNIEYISCPLSPKYAVVYIKKQQISTWVKQTKFVENQISLVGDEFIASTFCSYLSSNRYNVLYGKSEEQLRYMIQLLQSFHIQS